MSDISVTQVSVEPLPADTRQKIHVAIAQHIQNNPVPWEDSRVRRHDLTVRAPEANYRVRVVYGWAQPTTYTVRRYTKHVHLGKTLPSAHAIQEATLDEIEAW